MQFLIIRRVVKQLYIIFITYNKCIHIKQKSLFHKVTKRDKEKGNRNITKAWLGLIFLMDLCNQMWAEERDEKGSRGGGWKC